MSSTVRGILVGLTLSLAVSQSDAQMVPNGGPGAGRAPETRPVAADTKADTTAGLLVWPAPPEPARIRWVEGLTSESQLGRKESFFARLKRSIAGTSITGMYRISRPYDVAARDSSRIYTTDGVTRAVVVFDRASRKVEFLGADVPGGLAKPMGLADDERGELYVADQGARRIVVFDSAGRFRRAFGSRGELVNPVDVAADVTANRYYVVDSYLHQVVVFDSAGRVIHRLGRHTGPVDTTSASGPGPHGDLGVPGGSPHPPTQRHGVQAASSRTRGRDVLDNRGAGPAEFRYPISAAVGPDGTLWVVDQLNFRVQAFDRRGKFVRSVGAMGTTPGSLARPKGVGVDSEGHLYVGDAAFNNIQVFDAQGRLLLVVGGGGNRPGEFQLPLGLALDRHDRIYIADRYNNRLAIYQYLAGSNPAAAGAPRTP